MSSDSAEGTTPSSRSLIEADRLSFAYGKSPVVQDASLSLGRGALGALIGANGSGKTTLIRLLAGLIRPQHGVVLCEGVPLLRLEPRERAKRIAYVPQSSASVFPFTALEVVLTGRSPYSGRFRFESPKDKEVALASLASLDAAHLAGRPITELSGGERQLVTVARALAQEPAVLLLDEPASSLDLRHRSQLTHALRGLRTKRSIAVLMVTHDLMMLDSTFDVVYALKSGRIMASGTPRTVLDQELLADVYAAPVRTMRSDGRTFVWSE